MNSICITGPVQAGLPLVSDVLQHAGMQLCKPARRGGPVDIALWHERVMAAAAEESDDFQPISNVGMLWEQLATDIFVANIESKLWGWSSPHSTWLLDFWLNFEPRLNFILVCTSPQRMLASAVTAETGAISVEALMNAWQVHHQELLRFHHRNPQRSLLVDARECAENPGALIERCASQWRLPLETATETSIVRMEHDPLALYLAQQLCRGYPQTASLQHELAATITRLGDAEQAANAIEPEAEQIIANYRVLRDRSAELQQAQAAHEELALALAVLRDEQEKEVALLTQARNEQGTLAAEHQTKIEALIQERDSYAELAAEQQAQTDRLAAANAALNGEKAALVREKSEASQENELMLLQLHQVQEELEATFLKHESKQQQIDALTQERDSHAKHAAEWQAQIEILRKTNATGTEEKSALAARRDALQGEVAALAKARDEQSKLAAERQTRIQALTKERDSHARHAAEWQAQIEVLRKANATVTEEKSALTARRDALQGEVATLTKARDEQSKLAAERQSRIQALTKERDSHAKLAAERQAQIDQQQKDAATRLKEATQENELMLLQLHQVQEELEHHFLQHQDVQTKLKAADERWQRMLQRNPDYCDYESIEVVAAENGKGADTTWRIKNLNAGGRSLPALEFKTIIERGVAGFVLARQPGTTGPLIRWPANAANQDQLTLMPVGSRANVPQRIETLHDLATGDWDLLHTLTQLLANTLESPNTIKASASFQPEALRSGLGKLGEIIEEFPATLRYDRVTLKREQVNHDYEHLWLRLENLAFAGNRWPEFEFRLSCANVRPNRFGTHPKLEFPEESSQAPFEAWFIESYDDFGAKLELRFALPESMDIDVWQRVSENDRAFLSALIERLPAILDALRNAGTQINRPWDDWDKMAREMQRIVALRIAPPLGRGSAILELPVAQETIASPSKAAKPPRVPKTRKAQR